LADWVGCGKRGAWWDWENVVSAVVSDFGASLEIWPAGRRKKRFPNRMILVKVEE